MMKVRTEDGLHDSVSASGKLQLKVTFRIAQQNTRRTHSDARGYSAVTVPLK